MLQLKGAGEQEGRIQAPQRGPGGLSTEGRREGVRKSMFRDLGNTLMIHAQVLGEDWLRAAAGAREKPADSEVLARFNL